MKTSAKLKVSSKTKKLWQAALKVQKNAYAPYSNYHVGTAIRSGSKIITGCNVENASYGGTICSERGAILKAVSEGIRKFNELVVVTPGKNAAPPCGLCLQVMAEFCDKQMPIFLGTAKGLQIKTDLNHLLPGPYTSRFLKQKS